ncbi:MAG: hypothetical protein C0611_03310 [Desulfobacteraceae bacterium]|nr:MAG: hypothetical protein C0611_03310 [Desulfobacteraceae bacterium]
MNIRITFRTFSVPWIMESAPDLIHLDLSNRLIKIYASSYVCPVSASRCFIIVMIQICLIMQSWNPFLNGSVEIKSNIGSLLESIQILKTRWRKI